MTFPERRIPEATARRALRRLCAAYLAISGSVLLLPNRSGAWAALLVLHAVGVFILLEVGPFRRLTRWVSDRRPRFAAVVFDWYALLLMPLLYVELDRLNIAVHGGRYFDRTVLGWEEILFGGQPSQELASAFPHLVLSEALHFFYLSYYLIIYLPPLYLYLRERGAGPAGGAGDGRRAGGPGSRPSLAGHQHMVFALMLVFLVHYLFFIFFPVQGPRYLFPAPVGELFQGIMYQLAHAILDAGSSQGAAFPSSHVGVAFAQTALVFLFWRRAAPVLLLASSGLALGAVYAGFHYATDALAGLLLGLLLVALAPALALWMAPPGPVCRSPV